MQGLIVCAPMLHTDSCEWLVTNVKQSTNCKCSVLGAHHCRHVTTTDVKHTVGITYSRHLTTSITLCGLVAVTGIFLLLQAFLYAKPACRLVESRASSVTAADI